MGIRSGIFAGIVCCAVSSAAVAQSFDDVEIETVDHGSSIYTLYGAGGNIGLSVGGDGVLMIDDQFAPLSDKILAAVAELSDQPVTYLLNTHWHGDHVGGNVALEEQGAIILAHDNVRTRMSVEQVQEIFERTVPASPTSALPVITFSESATIHFNGHEIHVFHAEAGHTDGDSIVHFRDLNIVHMGDTLFTGRLPFIDFASGGSIYGAIAAQEKVLELADEKTVIVPGHGKVGNKEDLIAARDLLVLIRDAIQPLVDQGLTAEEIMAAMPLTPLGLEYGGFPEERFTFVIAAGMSTQ